MEIKDFVYRNTPVKKTRVYEVHTLSQDGLNQYMDKNSYVHKFLKNLSPDRTNFNNYSEQNNDYFASDSNLRNKLHNNEFNNNALKESREFINKKSNEKTGVITINVSNFHKNIYYNPASESANFEKKEYNNNFGNCINNEEKLENINFNKNEESRIIGKKESKEEKKNVETNSYFFSELNNKKNTFLQTSKHVFNNHNKFSRKRSSNHRYNSQKYAEDYLNTIDALKDKFNNNFITSNTSKDSVSPQKINYGTFKSFEVPHLDYKRQSDNFRINLIRNKLENTLQKPLKNQTNDSNFINNKDDLETINSRIEKENFKLKNYFNSINKFSKKDNQGLYPSVTQITNSKNLRTTKLKLLNNKFMGERYDPTNYC